MKKLLLLAGLIMAFAANVSAKDYVISNLGKAEDFTAGTYKYNDAEVAMRSGAWLAETGEKFAVVLKQEDNTNNSLTDEGNIANIHKSETELRVYKGFRLDITAPEGVSMKNVVFSVTGNKYAINFTATPAGTVTPSGEDLTITWNYAEGSNTLSILADSGQIRIAKVTISDEAGSAVDPEPEPEPTTVKVDNISALLKAANDTDVFELTNAVTAVYQNGSYLYINDKTGTTLVYGKLGKTYSNGQSIAAGITLTYSPYNGLVEFKPADVATFADGAKGVAVNPTEAIVSDCVMENLNKYVVIKDVEITEEASTEYKGYKYFISNGKAKVQVYDQFKLNIVKAVKGATIEGFVGCYNDQMQIFPTNITTETSSEAGKVASIAEFLALDPTTNDRAVIEFTSSVSVCYQNDKRLFVKDATGSLFIDGDLGQTYTNGMTIPAGFKGMYVNYKDYNGAIQMVVNEETKSTFQAGVAGDAVEPEEITVADITAANTYKYVIVKGVKVTSTSISDGENSANLSNLFRIDLVDAENVDVIGIIENRYGNVYFYPIEVLAAEGTTKVENIAAFLKGADETATYEFTNPLTVCYQNGSNLYVQDETGSMFIYGSLGQEYTNGMTIPAGVQGTYKNYYATIELVADAATFQAGVAGEAVEPATIEISELTPDHGNKYIVLKNVNVEGGYAVQGNYSIKLYDKFKLNNTGDAQSVDVIGVVSYYQVKGADKPELNIYPIEVKAAGGISDVEFDENAPSVYYNLQGVEVANPANGIFVRVQGGKAAKVVIR